MFEQNKRTRITQSGKNCAINCAIQGVRLIWKQKIWLAICEFLWSLTNHNPWCVSSFCTELPLFCTVFEKNCTALNQSEWRKIFSCILLDNEKQYFCTLRTCIFHLLTFWRCSRSFYDVLQLCGRCEHMMTNVQFCLLMSQALVPI